MRKKVSTIPSILVILVVALIAGAIITKNNSAEYDYNNNINYQKHMLIESSIFANNGKIPVQYTCDGAKTMIPLHVRNTPSGAKSLAIIVDDPDAPNGEFVHWVIWNIGPATSVIESNNIPSGATEGLTGVKKPGWVAPCPPSGVHHYNFKLYALDSMLTIPATSAKAGLVAAMNGHIIENATLVGLYGKGQ